MGFFDSIKRVVMGPSQEEKQQQQEEVIKIQNVPEPEPTAKEELKESFDHNSTPPSVQRIYDNIGEVRYAQYTKAGDHITNIDPNELKEDSDRVPEPEFSLGTFEDTTQGEKSSSVDLELTSEIDSLLEDKKRIENNRYMLPSKKRKLLEAIEESISKRKASSSFDTQSELSSQQQGSFDLNQANSLGEKYKKKIVDLHNDMNYVAHSAGSPQEREEKLKPLQNELDNLLAGNVATSNSGKNVIIDSNIDGHLVPSSLNVKSKKTRSISSRYDKLRNKGNKKYSDGSEYESIGFAAWKKERLDEEAKLDQQFPQSLKMYKSPQQQIAEATKSNSRPAFVDAKQKRLQEIADKLKEARLAKKKYIDQQIANHNQDLKNVSKLSVPNNVKKHLIDQIHQKIDDEQSSYTVRSPQEINLLNEYVGTQKELHSLGLSVKLHSDSKLGHVAESLNERKDLLASNLPQIDYQKAKLRAGYALQEAKHVAKDLGSTIRFGKKVAGFGENHSNSPSLGAGKGSGAIRVPLVGPHPDQAFRGRASASPMLPSMSLNFSGITAGGGNFDIGQSQQSQQFSRRSSKRSFKKQSNSNKWSLRL